MTNSCRYESVPVTSDIPQGSVLRSVLFVISISDMMGAVTSNVYLVADDAKMHKKVLTHAIDNVTKWSSDWLLTLSHYK